MSYYRIIVSHRELSTLGVNTLGQPQYHSVEEHRLCHYCRLLHTKPRYCPNSFGSSLRTRRHRLRILVLSGQVGHE
jgi:hypothetical protein